MNPEDPFDLDRFVQAQAGTYAQALDELHAGRKRTHWMWFVFPQLAGLGHSAMSRRYGLSGLDEARAYLAHPVLGERLRQCCTAVLASGVSAHALLGSPDDLKLRSCMTLFAHAALQGQAGPFVAVLERCFGGEVDPVTRARLAAGHDAAG